MLISAKCPCCNKFIRFKEEIEFQELVLCPYCRSLLEFVNKIPPTFDRFPVCAKNDESRKYALYKTVVRSNNVAK